METPDAERELSLRLGFFCIYRLINNVKADPDGSIFFTELQNKLKDEHTMVSNRQLGERIMTKFPHVKKGRQLHKLTELKETIYKGISFITTPDQFTSFKLNELPQHLPLSVMLISQTEESVKVGMSSDVIRNNSIVLKVITFTQTSWKLSVNDRDINLSKLKLSSLFECNTKFLTTILKLVKDLNLCRGESHYIEEKLSNVARKNVVSKVGNENYQENIVRSKYCEEIVKLSSVAGKCKRCMIDIYNTELKEHTDENIPLHQADSDDMSIILEKGNESEIGTGILKRGDNVEIIKCTKSECCNGLYHCPFCNLNAYKPTRASKTIDHINLSHFPHAVYYQDLIIVKCFQDCRKSGHYHCPVCQREILNRNNFKEHLINHSRNKEEDKSIFTPNGKQPEVIHFSEFNTVELCSLPCQDALAKHYHCPKCKIVTFQDVSSTLTHVWRCTGEIKTLKHQDISCTIPTNVPHPKLNPAIKYDISIVRSIEDLPTERCTLVDCCEKKFHCPLCTTEKFKPNYKTHLIDHYKVHWKNRLDIDGYASLVCYRNCLQSIGQKTHFHYHCPYCGITRQRKLGMDVHVDSCKKQNTFDNEPQIDMEHTEMQQVLSEIERDEKEKENYPLSTITDEDDDQIEILEPDMIENLQFIEPTEDIPNVVNQNPDKQNIKDNLKIFQTVCGIIPHNIQNVLGLKCDAENYLSDLCKSSEVDIQWFIVNERQYATVIGDMDSLISIHNKIKQKIEDEKLSDNFINATEDENKLHQNEVVQNMATKLIEVFGSNLLNTTCKIPYSKKFKWSQQKKLNKIKKNSVMSEMKSVPEKADDINSVPSWDANPRSRPYNTRGKRVKVYNKNGEILEEKTKPVVKNFKNIEQDDSLGDIEKIKTESPSKLNSCKMIKEEMELQEDEELMQTSVSTMTEFSDSEDNSQIKKVNSPAKKPSIYDQSPLYIPRIIIKDSETLKISNPYQCTICPNHANNFEELKTHILDNHSDNVKSQLCCEICKLFFKEDEHLESHLSSVHGPQMDLKFVCEHCKKGYKTQKLLNWHLSYVHKVTKTDFPCKKCEFVGHTLAELRKHNVTHRGKKTCEFCGKVFEFYCHLKSHLETVHKKSNNHTCGYCGKNFYHPRYLKQHLKRHTGVKSQICHICNKAFYESNTLKAHIETHSEPKDRKYRFVCSYCGGKYNNKTNFEEHLNKHTGNKPNKCSFCEKAFGFKSLLSQHVKFAHTNEKPFGCSLCEKTFKLRVRLNQHMTVHTGISKHTCTFCHKVFTCKTSLQKHLPKCKYQHNPLNKEDIVIIPKTEYLDENQILIVEMNEQTGEVTQLNDIKLENLETDITNVSLPSSNSEELFACSECHMAFVTFELAQEHILTSHSQ